MLISLKAILALTVVSKSVLFQKHWCSTLLISVVVVLL